MRRTILLTSGLVSEETPILFHYYTAAHEERGHVYYLSVPARSMPTVRNRAIVRFEGLVEPGIGEWSCSKDPRATHCWHIGLAKSALTVNESPQSNNLKSFQYDGTLTKRRSSLES